MLARLGRVIHWAALALAGVLAVVGVGCFSAAGVTWYLAPAPNPFDRFDVPRAAPDAAGLPPLPPGATLDPPAATAPAVDTLPPPPEPGVLTKAPASYGSDQVRGQAHRTELFLLALAAALFLVAATAAGTGRAIRYVLAAE